jgi:hypothetical protein
VVPSLLKAALAGGLVIGLAVELGRPAAARLELHDVARDAADLAEEQLPLAGRRSSQLEARAVVESAGAHLVGFEVDPRGRVEVRVARHVEPVVLDDLDRVRDWYDVEIDATSNGVPGT